MVIQKYESIESKGRQQHIILFNCRSYWGELNNTDFPNYPEIMNMKTDRYNGEHRCYVALTYDLNLNKW